MPDNCMNNMVASIPARPVAAASRQDNDIDLLPPYLDEYGESCFTQSQKSSPTLLDDLPRRNSSTRKPKPNLSLSSTVKIEALSTIEPIRDPDPARERRVHIFYRYLREWPWWWEAWACIGSLASFLATTGLLIAYQGKSQPEWPYGITLNSAVSWLTTITKGFLLIPSSACISQSIWISYSTKSQSLDRLRIYDSASRGPWGSLELLLALKARRLACVGALLIVLAIGIDPTVQQTITVRTRMVESEELATLPRAQTYLEYDSVVNTNAVNGWIDVPSIDMAGAMYSGLFKRTTEPQLDSNQQDVTPSCYTGNCTFPAFYSLAVCSRCDNITNTVVTTCNNIREQGSPPSSSYTIYQTCKSQLSNGLAITLTSILDHNITNLIIAEGMVPALAASAYLEPTIPPAEPNVTLSTMTILSGKSPHHGSQVNMTSQASQCSLSWCLRKYNASVYNGRFAEDTLDSSTGILEYKASPELLSMTPSNAIGQPRFLVSGGAMRGIKRWLQDRLTFQEDQHFWNNRTPETTDSGTITRQSESVRLFSTTKTEDIFTSLAKSMTTHMRSINTTLQSTDMWELRSEGNITGVPGPGEKVEPAMGTANKLHVYVDIRWEWLIFTGAILVLTICFFVLVVFQSAKNEVVVWKESPLALLFHGLQLKEERDQSGPMDLAGMESKAKKVRVRLRNGDFGVKLKECQ